MKYIDKKTKAFDPIKYLDISGVSQQEEDYLRKKLNKNISEYVLIRLLEESPDEIDEKLKNEITDLPELVTIFKSYFPDFEVKIEAFLKEFKKQYQNERE